METRNWIGGEWSTPNAGEVSVRNPSELTETVGTLKLSSGAELLQAVDAARRVWRIWGKMTGAARGECLYRMSLLLERNSEDVARLASREMGKPIVEMRGEVARGVQLLRYYAAEGVRAIGDVIPSTQPNVMQYAKRVPLGVVAIVTPWNFPVAIPIWKLAPALICGNTVVWKPAEFASLTAAKLAELFSEAGLPPGTLNLVIGKGSVLGRTLLEEASIDGLSFTGSTATGMMIGAACAARNVKYQTEMGGKNAAVVLKDANVTMAVNAVLSGAFRSAGQKCTATSRIIVEKPVYDEFVQQLSTAMLQLQVRNALDERAYLGPVASAEQFRTVMAYVEQAKADGRTLAAVEAPDSELGYYIAPRIIEGVDPEHALVQEEVFGPLAVVLPAEDVDEAIELANRTVFGLSASVFTTNLANAFRFLDEMDAGLVRVNQETAGVEYQAPFGGMKGSSSHTREQGQSALEFYSAVKTCSIQYR
ncbi:aldehyde dehydrogenase family protein [Cohnella herbarum]|uniref:Aldehyde dehydrogenase family protein n=1 Tax=Cohnella herbarum TaxID=2728023 RepID=A0A7Z2VRX2_9BACL|nr:aldehyde dehydrogenase family protein [Cohnella herbarum]QJD87810.1 aldehyde dehydrogenase family protein [Cohnella herbarum]